MTEHRHAHADPPYECVEIDDHVCLQPISHSLAPKSVVLNTPEADAYGTHPWGFIIAHDRDGFEHRCEGAIATCTEHAHDRPGRPIWGMTGTLEGGDLTLTPSILCQLGNVAREACGFHGWVRNGKWVTA